MSLPNGTKLAHYEIVEPIGKGGMGEVYCARDTKLGRDVAIKVLSEALSRDTGFLARFEREARLLASLNHPNIAILHGLEESDRTLFLVMELVEGETLDQQIVRGAMRFEEALRIFQQVAEAIEAAHDKGIVHRDLKPANIMLTPNGTAKVLDFGLAKAIGVELVDGSRSESPTNVTKSGMILGTVGYMSPEQARGKHVDKRTDIWGFGCVLYEVLSALPAFCGETQSDTLAAILNQEPDWSVLRKRVPHAVILLLRRCLQKDPQRRQRDIADVRVEIQEILAHPNVKVPSETANFNAPIVAWALASVLAVALLVSVWSPWEPETPSDSLVRFSINLADEAQPFLRGASVPALSPDGKTMAFVGQMPDGNRQLYIRSLDNMEPALVSGSQGAAMPFFSSDGRWVAFFAAGALKKASVSGGAALTVTEVPNARGGTWGPDDTIVYTPTNATGLYRVSASGGTPVELTTLSEGELSHRWPSFLPNGKALLFVVQTQRESFNDATIEAVFPDTGERKVIEPSGFYPRYASSGHLVYAREATLFAVPFDANRIDLTGEPSPVIEGVRVNTATGAALFAIAEDGTLAYVEGGDATTNSKLVFVDRQGKESRFVETIRAYRDPRLSPDGQRLAVGVSDDRLDLWILEWARGTLTRLTFEEGANNSRPIWSSGGERIIFSSDRGGGDFNIFSKPADGSGAAEQLTTGAYRIPTSVSSDGKTIVFRQNSETTGRDIGMVRAEGGQDPEMVLQTPFEEHSGMLSPDDHWLAYVSNESGREEVYTTRFPGLGGKLQISTAGGAEPQWSRDGRELFYRNGEKMMAVEISTGSELAIGKPILLFEGDYRSGVGSGGNPGPNYDVAPDGRFVMIRAPENAGTAQQINFVLNWHQELLERVPVP